MVRPDIAPATGARLWAWLESELRKRSAVLLPLRLFIALGWLRAGAEKLTDPTWRSGVALQAFFETQLADGAVHFPFYATLITDLFAPNAPFLGWIVAVGEFLAGVAILMGTLTSLALLGGLFMNLNFVLAGVVNPSAFYVVIQATLLAAGAGMVLGGDALLAPYTRRLRTAIPAGRWMTLATGLACTIAATLVVPYIRDFGPHSVDDPAMLLFILAMLGAMLAGIQFVRRVAAAPPARVGNHSIR